MNCLCCGKSLQDKGYQGWHKRCIEHFFATTELPKLEIDENSLNQLALESTTKGYTVPGVQKKLSLHLFSESGHSRLTLVNYPTGYILKPQVTEFEALPEAEQLVMGMADAVGIFTVPHALMEQNGQFAYITKRVDRKFEKDTIKMYAMEDFCQLDLRLTQDKYRGSYERCAKIIKKYSSRKGLDMTEFYLRILFSFVVGNSDMHLKNFSLRETEPGNRKFHLSKAYDMLPVNVIMPEDQEQLALTINGKKRNIHRKEFLILAESCGLMPKVAEHIIAKVCGLKEKFLKQVDEAYLSENQKEKVKELIVERIEILKKEPKL